MEPIKTAKILRQNKEKIIHQTIEHLNGSALKGDIYNVAFYVDKNANVGFHPFIGNQAHDNEVFFIIKDHERPDPEELGFGDINIEDIDYYAINYDSYIREKINNYINELEFISV